jgi:histidinol phosphatase-like PHP family hydrolase
VYGYQPDGPADGELVLYLSDEILMEVRPEYILAGAHGPLGAPPDAEAVVRQYHRQHMFCLQHPAVDVLVHPWWWRDPIYWETAWMDEHGHYTGLPWFDDFGRIPASMHDEQASAALENDVALEANAGAFFTNPHYTERFRETYLEYLADMYERGIKLALATDSHGAPYSPRRVEALQQVVERLGLEESDFWRPGPERAGESP